jgi:hypothetical protein
MREQAISFKRLHQTRAIMREKNAAKVAGGRAQVHYSSK